MTPEELAHARHMIEHTSLIGPVMPPKLIAHIDEQAAQITALKGLLIEERARYLAAERYSGWDFDMGPFRPTAENEESECEEWMEKAKKELIAKYPEAMK